MTVAPQADVATHMTMSSQADSHSEQSRGQQVTIVGQSTPD